MLTGEPLALDLINTRARTPDGDVDFLETADGLATWLDRQSSRLPTASPRTEPTSGALSVDGPSQGDPSGHVPSGGAPSGDGLSGGEVPDAWAEAVRRLRAHVAAAVTATVGGAVPPVGAVAALNEAARRAPSHLALGPSGVTTGRDAPPLDRLLAELAESAITLLGGPDAAKVKACEAPGCRMFFLPAHPRRRWCSPDVCGNRVRVARHYRRAKTGER